MASTQKMSADADSVASLTEPLAGPRAHGSSRPRRGASTSAAATDGDDGAVFVARTTRDDGMEGGDTWGFADTAFTLHDDGSVTMSGGRYGLCNERLNQLLPWVERKLKVRVPREPRPRDPRARALPAGHEHPAFVRAVADALGRAAIDASEHNRLRHGHGHTQEEMYAIKFGRAPRVPDLVVTPACERDVVTLVRLAQAHNVCLIPFGGGTNVSEALRCPEDEPRCIVSVDLAKLDRILWIDEANGLARIEAGAVGRHIAAALAERGLCIGHEPDSMEFSTLGGWIATHASGMKKNKYGNIEDIVQDMSVVTSFGLVPSTHTGPRQSVGVDVERCLFGSEGALGIVTSAVVKLFPLPEAQEYGSALFPCFEDGVAFMYALARARCAPASVRLVDNTQFQLGVALKGEKKGLLALKSRAEKLFVTKIAGYQPDRMAALTLVFEGKKQEVAEQKKRVYALCKAHGGMASGAENGRRGYMLTYSIAYIRDFVMQHGVLAESFETSLSWTQVLPLCDKVKARIEQEHRAQKLPGDPLVMCRVTQVYDSGAAVYFYYATSIEGVLHPTEAYAAIERAAREEVLDQGGSLSHHHGIGKLRQSLLADALPPVALTLRRQLKAAFDPHNVFGVQNGPIPS